MVAASKARAKKLQPPLAGKLRSALLYQPSAWCIQAASASRRQLARSAFSHERPSSVWLLSRVQTKAVRSLTCTDGKLVSDLPGTDGALARVAPNGACQHKWQLCHRMSLR